MVKDRGIRFLIMKKLVLSLSLIVSAINLLTAQVKIGDNPNVINANSMLELESTNKGFLPPRFALNNVNLVTPLTGTVPSGMLVYSSGGTVADGYYYWNGTKWTPITSVARNNYVLVKSVTDFPAPVAGIITLVAGTLYEINGSISLASKIELNNCTLIGGDETNDKLIYTGGSELFTGSNGGILRYLTLTATSAKVFNINGSSSPIINLFVSNCFFIGSNSIGTIQGMGGYIYFGDTGYSANTNGMTFQNNNFVYLNNSVWDISNSNTDLTFTGVFSEIQILGGRFNVNSGNTSLNITGITSLIKGSVKVAVFVGSGNYVNGIFSNAWEVESIGLNTEKDDVASGNLYISSSATTNFTASNTPTKVAGTTTSANLFRVTSSANNRLRYTGIKIKTFEVMCSLSLLPGGNNKSYSFYIAKNGTKLPESQMTAKSNSSSDQISIPVSCVVSLSPNDYIEIWCENNVDNTNIIVTNMNLAIK